MEENTLTKHAERIHAWAKEKGWAEPLCKIRACATGMPEPIDPDAMAVAMKIALVHSEISEALEEVRKGEGHYGLRYEDGKPEGVVVELADAYIRIVHLCAGLGLDLAEAVEAKLAYNETRKPRHGGKAC